MSSETKKIELRCFVYYNMKYQKFSAFCIDLNIACQDDSQDGVIKKLSDGIELYLVSQLEYYEKNNIKGFPYRKSPLSIRINYHVGLLITHLVHNIQKFVGSFDIDSQKY